MRRRPWFGVLVLGFVTVSLGAFAYWQHQTRQSADPSRPLMTLNPKDVESIVLHSGDGTIVANKTAGQWRITTPRPLPADQDQINGLVRYVTGLTYEQPIRRFFAGESTASKFGLAPPRFRVEFRTKSETAELWVGERNPFDGRVYVASPQSRVVILVDANIEYQVDRSVFDLRDRRIAPLEVESVQRVRLERGSGPVQEVVRNTNGFYYLERDSENPVRLKSSSFQALLRHVATAEASLILEAQSAGRTPPPESDRWVFETATASHELTLWTEENPTRYLVECSALGVVVMVTPRLHRELGAGFTAMMIDDPL